MIKLDVKPYCHECPNFQGKVDKDVVHSWDISRLCTTAHATTTITCENADVCDRMYTYLNQQHSKEPFIQ